MSYNENGGRQPRQKKEKINEWTGIGTVNSRGRDQDIRFVPFQNGGGCIHINLVVEEVIGNDQNGCPRTKTSYIPVNVMTNTHITAQQLQAVRPGQRVRVAGSLTNESYEDRQGQKHTLLVVRAFVLEQLEQPVQPFQMPQAGQTTVFPPQYQPQAPQYPPQPFPGQYGQQVQAPSYTPQAPQYPGQSLQYGQQPCQGQYAPQGQTAVPQPPVNAQGFYVPAGQAQQGGQGLTADETGQQTGHALS